jgi:hypothetical protein
LDGGIEIGEIHIAPCFSGRNITRKKIQPQYGNKVTIALSLFCHLRSLL